MHRSCYAFILCIQTACALLLSTPIYRFIPAPKSSHVEDLDDGNFTCPTCVDVELEDWNVTITTYGDSDVISRIIMAEGAWEAEQVKQACDEYVRYGAKGNMFDVGANIGAFTLPLAACLKKYSKDDNAVFSVEAVKNSSQKLLASIKRNNFDNIRLFEYAVSAPIANDTVIMREEDKNKGHSHVWEWKPLTQREYEVPVTTIDAITKVGGDAMKQIFFMKMDIEGYEPTALQGAEEFMNDGPCIIFVELHNSSTKPMLEQWGYVQYKSNNGTGGQEGWFKHANMTKCTAKL